MKLFHVSQSARSERKPSLFLKKTPIVDRSAGIWQKSHFLKKALIFGACLLTAATLNVYIAKAGDSTKINRKNNTEQSEKTRKTSPLKQAKFCDLAQLCKDRVVYFGDMHFNVQLQGELIAQLPALKKAGFTHLAVEYEQKTLANYSTMMKNITMAELAVNMVEKYGSLLESVASQSDADSAETAKLKKAVEFFKDPENARQYKEIIAAAKASYALLDSARRLGFTIIAADSLGDFEDKMKEANLSKTENEKTIDKLVGRLGSLASISEIRNFVFNPGPRNRYMARQVSEALANPNNRVLVFIGAGHLVKSGVPALVSEATGESGPIIVFSYYGAFQDAYSVDQIYKTIRLDVSARKWDTKRFALPAAAVGKETQYDWYFHLPEETK